VEKTGFVSNSRQKLVEGEAGGGGFSRARIRQEGEMGGGAESIKGIGSSRRGKERNAQDSIKQPVKKNLKKKMSQRKG